MNIPVDRYAFEEVIRQAGVLLLSRYQKKGKDSDASGESADRQVERFLIENLTRLLPHAAVYAEESGVSGASDVPYTWVLDPLDGSTNFTRGFSYFCISVALTYQGRPVLGVVYQPVVNQLVYAQQGKGVWLNGERILSRTLDIPNPRPIVVSAYGLLGQEIWQENSIRYCGAVALDCAYVAAGIFDGIVLTNLAWWDIAAGVLLLQEAGCTVTDYQSEAQDSRRHTLVAAGPQELHRMLYNAMFYASNS